MHEATQLFRAGLLSERPVALAGPVRPAIESALGDLGARLRAVEIGPDEAAPADLGTVDALVVDTAAAFAQGAGAADGELDALRAAADAAWLAIRAVANAAWIEPQAAGGKVVLVAPRSGDGPHATAARAALENLARTLSIEWARYGIRTTTIAPGPATTDADVAATIAYLVSPAGDYFSGALLELA